MKKNILAFLLFMTLATQAQTFTPDALVRDLYKIHGQDSKTSKDRILNGKSRKYIDKYFDKTLADQIWKDLTISDGYSGVIDFDPFYATQDPDVKNLSISIAKITETKATVIVKFTNSGIKTMLNYHLIKQNTEWKIDDIKYDHNSSLSGYFKEAGK